MVNDQLDAQFFSMYFVCRSKVGKEISDLRPAHETVTDTE